MLPTALILLLLGIAVWLLSRVGFCVSHHPFCRACGFDLFMLPLETQRCPECGADILANDAIRIGHRRPVRAGMIVGAIITLAGAALLGIALFFWWSAFDGSRFKTVAQLEREIAAPEPKLRTRACEELQHRIRTRALSPADADRLAEIILQLQADPAVNWEERWGDLVQQSHLTAPASPAGPLLSQNLWGRFVQQAMQITAQARPRVRTGDPIPIAINCKLKAGTDWLVPSITFKADVVPTIGALAGNLHGRTQTTTTLLPLQWTLLWQPSPASAEPLPRGPQTLHLAVILTARDGTALIQRAEGFDLPVEWLEAADSSVTLHTLPTAAARQEIEDALQWRLRTLDDGTISLAGKSLGNLWVADPPITAAFRIVLRQDEPQTREWLLSRFMVQPSDASFIPLTLPTAAPGPHPGSADIVCIPDPTLATGTVDVLEVWGIELHHPITLAP